MVVHKARTLRLTDKGRRAILRSPWASKKQKERIRERLRREQDRKTTAR